MSIPGFNAVHSLRDLELRYTPVFSLDSSLAHSARLQPALPPRLPRNGGGNGGPPPRCRITCGSCDSNCVKQCTITCTDGTKDSFSRSCCGPGFSCQNGACVCPSPKTVCGGVCTDTSSDSSNCGQCGSQCSPGQTCQQGGCFPQPTVCSPCTGGFITCCTRVSPDQNLCGLQGCCQTFKGACTGAGGADQCVAAGGTKQCCHSNWFYGWQPWITVCGSFSGGTPTVQVTQGCGGPCL